MKSINCKIKGVVPLLQHRFPDEEHGANVSKGKKKVYNPEEEAKKALFVDGDGKIYHPAEHVYSAMIKAAVNFRFEGKKTYKEIVKGGIILEPECIPLENKNARSKKTWDEIDARNVVIQRSRVIRWRPRFNDWALSFRISIIDDENISPITLKEILEKAGQLGIGDYRPRFGRFMVTEFEEDGSK